MSGATAPSGPFTTTAGFRLTQNAIQVEATLDGQTKPRTFLLDSGAPMTISQHLAHESAREPHGEITLLGPDGGKASVPVARIDRVEVAGSEFRDVGSVVDWSGPPSPLACLSRDGLLGASLLETAIWQIDFHEERITVTDRLADLPGLDLAVRVPFRRSDTAGSPRIEVEMNETSDLSALIDLGFNGSVAMPAALYRRAGNELRESMPAERGHGATTVLGDAASRLYVGRVRDLRFGGLHLRDFPVLTGAEVSDFHIGVAFLRHFRVTLDWRNDHLYLQRRDPEHALFEDYASYGFTPTLREGRLVVGALWEDGAAARAGLKLGDTLLAVDGRSTVSLGFEGFCDLLDSVSLYGSGQEPIEVTVERNGVATPFRLSRTPLVTHRHRDSQVPAHR